MDIKKFIGENVWFKAGTNKIMFLREEKGQEMLLAEISVWNSITPLFTKDGITNYEEAYAFQEKLGRYIADAIRNGIVIRAVHCCDVCGCHPSVIVTTPFGTFCQQHARHV